MEQLYIQGGEPTKKITSVELRHPTQELFESALAEDLQRLRLRSMYDEAEVAMNAFFAAGHPRPKFGDESY